MTILHRVRHTDNSGIECDRHCLLLLITSTRITGIAVVVVTTVADACVGCPCLVVLLILIVIFGAAVTVVNADTVLRYT